jgi:hypothetical protein
VDAPPGAVLVAAGGIAPPGAVADASIALKKAALAVA